MKELDRLPFGFGLVDHEQKKREEEAELFINCKSKHAELWITGLIDLGREKVLYTRAFKKFGWNSNHYRLTQHRGKLYVSKLQHTEEDVCDTMKML